MSFISIVYVIIVEVFCVMEGAHFSKRHLILCEVDFFVLLEKRCDVC